MYQTVRKQIRPNTSVEFYSPDQSPNITRDILRYQFNTYIQTGKQLDVVKNISEDGLTQTITILWDSQASQEAYINDPTIKTIFEDGETYRTANGIDMQVISTGEV
jgi:hypothetical protein